MSEHLPLDAFEEQHEEQEISFMWSLVWGVVAVIIPLTLYLLFYFSQVKNLLPNFIPMDLFMVTLVASFASPYLICIMALVHAKRVLRVSKRGALLKHSIYVILIPCAIGLVAFCVTLIGEEPEIDFISLISFLSLFYIPYIIVGVIMNTIITFFMSRKQPLISNKTFF